MRTEQTEILVIGGGSTGAGLLRDLAMRGFAATLVEKEELNQGATRRYHGLLHSGGRYVVTDPEAAKECVEENRILRRIMPHGIDDTGGFFVMTKDDDPAFAEQFLMSARQVGMPVEKVGISQMLKEEPHLSPDITYCFWVSDGVSYAYISTGVTAKSAREHGGKILTRHELKQILRNGDRVVGAVCYDRAKDEEVTIHADMVINATGPWAGATAALAGVEIKIIPSKGTMVSIDHIPLRTVLNRCRPPANGDIIVPKHNEAIVGTTDIPIEDPDDFGVTGDEVQEMLAAGEELMPGFSRSPMIRAWSGVRPLFEEGVSSDGGESRGVSRSYALLDHAERDGIDGFLTITGGKWTTHRLMAEHGANLVCKKLGVERPCRTHLERLPELDE